MNFKLDVGEMSRFHIKTIDRTFDGQEGIQYIFKFPNDYGASVVKHFASYGYSRDLWEIGYLVEVTDDNWILGVLPSIYSRSSVRGNLTDDQVYKELIKIKEYK